MLKRLHLRNFTVFADAEFEFGEGLNVLVGANGTGKTHVLKAGYAMRDMLTGFLVQMRDNVLTQKGQEALLNNFYFDKFLLDVFQPIPFQMSQLIRRNKQVEQAEIEVVASSYYGQATTSFLFTDSSFHRQPVQWLPLKKDKYLSDPYFYLDPVLIPAKEILTMGWLLSVNKRFDIPIDISYVNLLDLLSGPPLRQPEPAHIVEKLAQLIGGKVEEEGGHFYLATENQPRLEMNLVAEGMRKFATLYKLLANGTLTPETTLFWDEPEANLNPALLKELAAILTDLAQAGFQIILATHSLFLMRELHILAQRKKKPVRYFGLYKSEEGDVRVECQDDLMQLQHLVALDAELAQTFDFEAALDEDYAGDN
jgi:energy-coupling factor transporter ATP-binding protein EcfA2